MFCSNCGKEIIEGKKFCPYCGKSLITNGVSAAADKKIEFHLNKALVVSVFEIALIALLVWGFMRIGESLFGPESLAKAYMKAIAEDDWDKVMSLTDSDETEFINKSSLKEAALGMIPDDFDSYEATLRNERGSEASVKVKYGSDGKMNNDVDMVMTRQNEKALFIFNTWKVSDENYKIKDFKIFVPSGTDAYFDGVKLSNEMIEEGVSPSDEDENIYSNGISYTAYIIPSIYVGTHQAAALIGDSAIAVQDIKVSNEKDKVILSEVFPSKELQSQIIDTACSDLERIITAKVNGDSFETIKDIFIDDNDVTEYIQRNYENSMGSYYAYDKETGISKIKVKELKGVMQDFYISNEGDILAKADIGFKYDYSKISKSWWDSSLEENTWEDNSGDFYACMTYIDGDWKIKEVQLPYGM